MPRENEDEVANLRPRTPPSPTPGPSYTSPGRNSSFRRYINHEETDRNNHRTPPAGMTTQGILNLLPATRAPLPATGTPRQRAMDHLQCTPTPLRTAIMVGAEAARLPARIAVMMVTALQIAGLLAVLTARATKWMGGPLFVKRKSRTAPSACSCTQAGRTGAPSGRPRGPS